MGSIIFTGFLLTDHKHWFFKFILAETSFIPSGLISEYSHEISLWSFASQKQQPCSSHETNAHFSNVSTSGISAVKRMVVHD